MYKSFCSALAFVVLAVVFGTSAQGKAVKELSNELPVKVGLGLYDSTKNIFESNVPTVSITLCIPHQPADAEHCQTIDHIIVDTGATGVRIMSSVLHDNMKVGLKAEQVQLTSDAGRSRIYSVAECMKYSHSAVRGSVAKADVWLGSEPAQRLADPQHAIMPIQIIGAADIPAEAMPYCDRSVTEIQDTVKDFGGNGTIGLNAQLMDNSFFYYACDAGSGTCVIDRDKFENGGDRTTVRISQDLRVPNPVYRMPRDNNGVVLELDNIPNHRALVGQGRLMLGIGTRSNNALKPGTQILHTYDVDNGENLPDSYELTDPNATVSQLQTQNGRHFILDSGARGLEIYAPSVPRDGEDMCFRYVYYCADPAIDLALTFTSPNHQPSKIYNLSIARIEPGDWFRAGALDAVAMPIEANEDAIFGLPFFFGKRIYVANQRPQDAVVNTLIFDSQTGDFLGTGSDPMVEPLPVAPIVDSSGNALTVPFYGVSPQTPKFSLSWSVQRDAAGAVRKGYTMVGGAKYEDEGVYFMWRNDTLDPSIRAASSRGAGPISIGDQSIYDAEHSDLVYRDAPGHSAGAFPFQRLFGPEGRPQGERYKFKSDSIINDSVPDKDGFFDFPITYDR